MPYLVPTSVTDVSLLNEIVDTVLCEDIMKLYKIKMNYDANTKHR